TNNGPDTATGVTVQDTLPAGVAFVSASPSQGSYNPGTGVWTVGTVAVGAAPTLILTVRATSSNPQANTAAISHPDQLHPNSANHSGTAPVNPQQAYLALAKTVSDPQPNAGATVTFTVTLTNNGPSSATGVQVTDLLPTGLTLVSAAPGQGTYNSTTGVWNVGTLASGAQVQLSLQATVVSPATQTNTARISAADQF